jgi:hypothetical protein
MPTNPYFNFTLENNEQTLVEDLITEAIQIYGHSAYYIPREDANMDRLFGEDPLSSFDQAFELEVYLKSSTNFGGNDTLMTKFGVTIEDTLTLLISMRRFNQVLGTRMARPREGDIIFLSFFGPAWRYLFEVRFVNSTEQLFQLGKLYTYELKCETMNYSHERVRTAIPDINRVAAREAATFVFHFVADNIAPVPGIGDYMLGEVVVPNGQDPLNPATPTATVAQWDKVTRTLSVQNLTGDFINGSIGNLYSGTIVGVTSGASYYYGVDNTVGSFQALPQPPTNLEPSTLGIADNQRVDTEQPTVVLPTHNPRFNQ